MGSMNVSHRAHHHVSHHGHAQSAHHASAQKAQLQAQTVTLPQKLQAFLGQSSLVAQPANLPVPNQPTVSQAEFELVKAQFEAQQNPGLTSDLKLLGAAERDLAAYERSEPNSARTYDLRNQVAQLEHQVTQEAIDQVDQALSTYFQSGGTRQDMQTLYNSVRESERALGHTARDSAAMEFTSALSQYLGRQLMPPLPVFCY